MTETTTLEDIEQKTRVKLNIYKVPIEEISFMKCTEGNIQGSCLTHCFIEGKSPQDAILNLIDCPDYWKNWNNYAPIIRDLLSERRFKPFKINLDGKIEQIPECNERHKIETGAYVCGVPCTEGEPDICGINGEFGDCICKTPWANKKDDLRQCCPYRAILR